MIGVSEPLCRAGGKSKCLDRVGRVSRKSQQTTFSGPVGSTQSRIRARLASVPIGIRRGIDPEFQNFPAIQAESIFVLSSIGIAWISRSIRETSRVITSNRIGSGVAPLPLPLLFPLLWAGSW